jgi:hypothetical protein
MKELENSEEFLRNYIIDKKEKSRYLPILLGYL